MSRLRIVLAVPQLAEYPQGGGHWAWSLQYLLGFRDLGHDVFCWTELSCAQEKVPNTGLIDRFLHRMTRLGFGGRSAVLIRQSGAGDPTPDNVCVYGMSRKGMLETARSADLLWNFSGILRTPLRSLFAKTALCDTDPAHFQICAALGADRVEQHDAYFSVGLNLHGPACDAPTLGIRWHCLPPAVFLPMWSMAPDPRPDASFTSVTHWSWEELWFGGRVLSVSKRDAYLEYVKLPSRVKARFELAACIYDQDRDLLQENGWSIADPYEVAPTPGRYRRYIRNSRGEFGCAKPIHKLMQTGWFSDRSAAYLASGRPVLCEETGFSQYLPTGCGLLAFRNMDEAATGVAAIASDYQRHQRAAREIAEEHLDSRKLLPMMIDAIPSTSAARIGSGDYL